MTSKSTKILMLIGVSLLSFTGYLDVTIVSTALPAIESSLHMSVTELQWVMSACFLGVSAFMASMGRIADIYGRRRLFYIGTIIFGFASLGAGMSTLPAWLIFFRAIQGVTIAITIPVGIALIQTVFDKREIAKAMGIFGTITGAGLALGPVVGGALVTAFGWPSIFFVNIPFVIIGFALCLFSVKESRSKTKMRLDYFGILFLALTISALVFALVEANIYGWGSPLILGSFITFIVSLVLLIITESKVAHPVMAGALFKNPVFISSMLFSFAGGGLMSVVLFIDPLYLHLILNKSIWMTGVFLFIIPLVVTLCSPIIGQINHHTGSRLVMIFGALCFLFAALGHLFFSINLNYAFLVFSFVLFGLGWGIVNQVPAVALGQSIHDDHLSVGMGALFTFFNIGTAVLLAVGVTLFHWRAMQSLTQNFAQQHLQINEGQAKLLQQFVNQPDQMHQILQKLNLTQTIAGNVFKNAFITGMHAMYWPPILLAGMAFFAITWLMKTKAASKKL